MSIIIRKVHIGHEIAKRITQLGISRSEFARRAGMLQQHVKGLLERQSLDTEKLTTICEALDFNFFSLYGDSVSINAYRSAVTTGDGNATNYCGDSAELQVRNELLAEKITMLENIIEDKNKIIRLMESKAK